MLEPQNKYKNRTFLQDKNFYLLAAGRSIYWLLTASLNKTIINTYRVAVLPSSFDFSFADARETSPNR
jgi:hypothetical protein